MQAKSSFANAPPRPFELGHAEIDNRFVATWTPLASHALPGRSRIGSGPTRRSRIRRHRERAHYDRDTVFAIPDAALTRHIGYVIDGLSYVTPTLSRRDGERLYWHGSLIGTALSPAR